MSNPDFSGLEVESALLAVESDLRDIAARLQANYGDLKPEDEALEEPKWGTSEVEIPILPITGRGVLLDSVTPDLQEIAKTFVKVRNISPQAEQVIASTKVMLKELKTADPHMQLEEAVGRAHV